MDKWKEERIWRKNQIDELGRKMNWKKDKTRNEATKRENRIIKNYNECRKDFKKGKSMKENARENIIMVK